MSRQTFRDESNWKHQPETENYVDDKFGKGANTRNWKKNLDSTVDATKKGKASNAEIIPVAPGNHTKINLDKEKTKTQPGTNTPERHKKTTKNNIKLTKRGSHMNVLQDLKDRHLKLLLEIKKIESELRKPLKKDLDANAIGERTREVLNEMYEIEKMNLARIDDEISKHLGRDEIKG